MRQTVVEHFRTAEITANAAGEHCAAAIADLELAACRANLAASAAIEIVLRMSPVFSFG